jgi:hypothetical protein
MPDHIVAKRQRWNIFIRIGLGLIIFGWGPMLAVILLSSIGLWPDPNPNPIGLGLLCAASFFPAVICITIGILRACRSSADESPESPSGIMQQSFSSSAAGRWMLIVGGILLAFYGLSALTQGNNSRGAAACIILGVFLAHWGISGKMPG